MQLNNDKPLDKKDALEPGKDKLGRRGFAESVVKALSHVNKDQGLVLSIEGKWGSGKTSTLAMIEALLEQQTPKPLVVYLNPWLVGDRDALLGQFLSKVGKAAKLSEHAKDGKRVAKEIEAYSKAFDVVKLIPGAEPWASIVKSVFTSVGSATGAIADYKTPDLEERKRKVEGALSNLAQSIIVVVDDVDRLFPKEVFEMVRIIKAVGDLPNIGYVLAWDPDYVESALKSADVAAADVYLDKIVQVRMSLPVLSNPARARLFTDAYEKLPDAAKKSYFPNDQELLPKLYQSNLRKLLEQPRDIARLFNRVQLMEPKLRGNVVLADQIGWAALSLYAPSVANLVQSEFDVSESYADDVSARLGTDEVKKEKFKIKSDKRHKVILESRNPDAVRCTTQFLFPCWSAKQSTDRFDQFRDDEGRISHSNRFNVVRQWGASEAEVDLLKARQFLSQPMMRSALISSLNDENCLDFLEALNGLSFIEIGKSHEDKLSLFLALSRALDQDPFSIIAKKERWSIERAQFFVWRVISEILYKIYKGHGHEVAEAIVTDPKSLSMAATLLDSHWINHDPTGRNTVRINKVDRQRLTEIFAQQVSIAVEDERFWQIALPGRVLKTVTQCDSDLPQQIFSKLIKIDSNLDRFVQTVFLAGHSSAGGDYYELNEESHRVRYSKLCPIDELKELAEKRLADTFLDFPVRAAWMAVSNGKKIFENGKDANL
jgi:hypothetical protein